HAGLAAIAASGRCAVCAVAGRLLGDCCAEYGGEVNNTSSTPRSSSERGVFLYFACVLSEVRGARMTQRGALANEFGNVPDVSFTRKARPLLYMLGRIQRTRA